MVSKIVYHFRRRTLLIVCYWHQKCYEIGVQSTVKSPILFLIVQHLFLIRPRPKPRVRSRLGLRPKPNKARFGLFKKVLDS